MKENYNAEHLSSVYMWNLNQEPPNNFWPIHLQTREQKQAKTPANRLLPSQNNKHYLLLPQTAEISRLNWPKNQKKKKNSSHDRLPQASKTKKNYCQTTTKPLKPKQPIIAKDNPSGSTSILKTYKPKI